MSRAAFFDALVNDTVLNGFGITDETVFHNYSNDERPSDTGPFIILRWGEQDAPFFENMKSPERVTVWVHWPKELTNDYTRLIKILDQIDNVVLELRDVPGSDDYTLSFVTLGSRSGDFFDDGFDTITKNANYEVYTRLS